VDEILRPKSLLSGPGVSTKLGICNVGSIKIRELKVLEQDPAVWLKDRDVALRLLYSRSARLIRN